MKLLSSFLHAGKHECKQQNSNKIVHFSQQTLLHENFTNYENYLFKFIDLCTPRTHSW